MIKTHVNSGFYMTAHIICMYVHIHNTERDFNIFKIKAVEKVSKK